MAKRKLSPRGKVIKVPVPKSRDPFVNTPLISVGKDKRGHDRFWISTWNSAVGCIGLLIDETGEYRIYRFKKPNFGFYSAVQTDANTLWMCCLIDAVVKFNLDTGKHESFPTGVPSALIFQGMVYDKATGKLFAAAFPPPNITAFSFDTRTRKTGKVHTDFCPEHYMRASFPNGDGTWTIVLAIPGVSFLRWDPKTDKLTVAARVAEEDQYAGSIRSPISDERGRRYFSGRGWFNSRTAKFDKSGPRPEKEMAWFARRGDVAYGAECKSAMSEVSAWDMKTGAVRYLFSVPDIYPQAMNITKSGKIVCVNIYGEFSRFDAKTGALEMAKHLPTDSVGAVDCVCRVDDRRILGTPFITERFWEADIRTGDGRDCGRAAPGAGQICLTRKLGGKVYMAAYGGGELVEYDPRTHPHFPENPRVVADAPEGMRPVAMADDGRNIYYACSAHYGKLGSTLARYDTHTGEAKYAINPLPDQQIRSICHDRKTNTLLCGTTYDGDCESAPPSTDKCFLAHVGADDLTVQEEAAAPAKTREAMVVGPVGAGKYLCVFRGESMRWGVVSVNKLGALKESNLHALPEKFRGIKYAGKPGMFVMLTGDRLELWDMRKNKCLKALGEYPGVGRFFVQDDSLYVAVTGKILILEHCL